MLVMGLTRAQNIPGVTVVGPLFLAMVQVLGNSFLIRAGVYSYTIGISYCYKDQQLCFIEMLLLAFLRKPTVISAFFVYGGESVSF